VVVSTAPAPPELFAAALPPGTAVNVCTASGLLLDAISGTLSYSVDPQRLATRRQSGCFPTLDEFNNALTKEQKSQLASNTPIADSTHYFRLWSRVTIGTSQFSLYSLLLRDGAQIRPILRTFGTE